MNLKFTADNPSTSISMIFQIDIAQKYPNLPYSQKCQKKVSFGVTGCGFSKKWPILSVFKTGYFGIFEQSIFQKKSELVKHHIVTFCPFGKYVSDVNWANFYSYREPEKIPVLQLEEMC